MGNLLIYLDYFGILTLSAALIYHFRIAQLIQDKQFLLDHKNPEQLLLYKRVASRRSRITLIILLLLYILRPAYHIISGQDRNTKVMIVVCIVIFAVIFLRALYMFKPSKRD